MNRHKPLSQDAKGKGKIDELGGPNTEVNTQKEIEKILND